MSNADNSLLDRLVRDAGAGVPELDSADEGMLLVQHLDYVAQLAAIRDLLQLHDSAGAAAAEGIRRLEREAGVLSGLAAQQAVDEWVERLHGSVYQDAAHSMAAVGMLAPLAESLFQHALLSLGKRHHELGLPLPAHPRFRKDWRTAWNPKVNDRKGVVAGIREICDAAGIGPYLPLETGRYLDALFAYRNAMFHNGFEWPESERASFHDRAKAWPGWFVWSVRGDEPWIAYMTPQFVEGMIATLDGTIEGLGRFAVDLRKRADPRRG